MMIEYNCLNLVTHQVTILSFQVFHNKERLMDHLDNLENKMGGDCEEKTCLGMLRAMYNQNFIRKGISCFNFFCNSLPFLHIAVYIAE